MLRRVTLLLLVALLGLRALAGGGCVGCLPCLWHDLVHHEHAPAHGQHDHDDGHERDAPSPAHPHHHDCACDEQDAVCRGPVFVPARDDATVSVFALHAFCAAAMPGEPDPMPPMLGPPSGAGEEAKLRHVLASVASVRLRL